MPSAISQDARAATPDDLDALFDTDVGLDEVRRSATTTAANESIRTENRPETSNLDEEIVITKKRQPIAKLDEERILSSKGIPRLRKIAKKTKFKGKGHEFSDMSRLLNMYQLWLDELYPRAKFADGLAMIEKLGHKKRIQMMRKEWIDEGKPRHQDSKDTPPPDNEAPEPDQWKENNGEDTGSAGVRKPVEQNPSEQNTSASGLYGELSAQAEPDEDELDALMAEQQGSEKTPAPGRQRDDFADEEEAMAGMDW
ncbi:replication fork protection component Swi3-domain-containing protein [Elsinoe ampelina]|uniref:Chromosome segregation in meiosis protein n=1 Tax=Elsinoe ampelina TaxID=302913 RepID=A0A6A6GLQ0_9PEZI|nr:replication fork protection component Swi3-domain-containing protein [Elsinoe ampelina]